MLIKFVINRKIFDIISHMNSYSLLVLLQTHPPRMKHGRPRQHFRFSSPGTDCISRLVTGGVGARRTRGASFQAPGEAPKPRPQIITPIRRQELPLPPLPAAVTLP